MPYLQQPTDSGARLIGDCQRVAAMYSVTLEPCQCDAPVSRPVTTQGMQLP